ncbi:MAG: restriction endonuclease subunit S [Gemmatimonadota bacterium]|nr:restriction endonuclease subunit S [Gemmatimonadota bacterium]
MSLPRYPRYKDSGLEWLGQVPEHWSVRRLGFYFTERREKVSDREFPPLSVTRSGIVPQLETAAKTDDGDNRKKVCRGDFVINSRSDRKGSSGISKFDGSVSLISTVIQPQEALDPMFVHHLLRSQPFQEEYYRFGKGIVADLWSTSYSEMRNIVLAVPPTSEQQAIAYFIEGETMKIDALIAEQQRLIELLKEKRQAVISHAVTRGLDPDAPMKASGVEWLGHVPAHWEVRRLKHLTPQITVGIVVEPSQYYVDKGVPALRSLNVRPGAIRQESMVYISPEANETLAKSRLRAGDLVAVRSGQPGTTAVIPDNLDGCNCIDLIIIRKPHGGSEWFLSWFLGSDAALHQFDTGSGGAIQQHFNIGTAMDLLVPTPPVGEQHAIAEYLRDRSERFDALTAEAERAIALLQERRTALISAAVTGKIDVRGLAQTEAEAA